MTKDEALKLALEALNDLSAWNDGEVGGHMDEPYSAEVARRTITAIKEALAQPEQKPVAVKHMMRWVDNLKWQSDNGQHMNIPSGLSSGTCWELAIELEQFIKSTPPQRTWVELTHSEFAEILCDNRWQGRPELMLLQAQDKLKEKNKCT